MITFNLRSSSVNDYRLCELRFFINYVLGHKLKLPTSHASRGTALHKALEILGLRQLAIQEGATEFTDDETGKQYNLTTFTNEEAIQDALDFYIKEKEVLVEEDRATVVEWFNTTLIKYKEYTPLGQKVKRVEQFFELEFTEPWAEYSWDIQGKTYTGNLGLKGTVDLLFDINPNTIELIDYKSSGSRGDWITGKQKNTDNLVDDFQLQLYYYALHKLYPDISNILITILFVRAGGPFSPPFEKSHIPKIEERIRLLWEDIKQNNKPGNIKRDRTQSFKCNWCPFKETIYEKTGKSYCDFFEKEIKELGLTRVTNKYFNPATINNYEGGGRSK